MTLKVKHLWTWNGSLARMPFIIWGMLLFTLKYNLDRLLVYTLFGRNWSVFSYFEQPLPGVHDLSPAQSPKEYLILLLAALPFLWAGVLLCLKRLRAAQLPLWLAVVFVAPVAKWFLFVVLALVPSQMQSSNKTASSPRWLPRSVFGSAALAVGASVLLAALAMLLSTAVLRDYSYGLFVGVPFSMGFLSSLIYGAPEPRRLGQSLAVAMVSVFIAGALLLALALEGVICLVMAAPLAFVLAMIGAIAGHVIQSGLRPRVSPPLYCLPVILLAPMFYQEALRSGPPPSIKVVTAIEVAAPIHTVWNHVIEFNELPPPTETLFKLGIAYPIRAEIRGHGPGAVRNCLFSTGPFVEPIEIWDEPHLLKFSVTSNPAPLQEWTPYHQIHPPHLRGFLGSEQGQFELTSLPDGRTLLEGTTWYHHTLWPVRYWQVWSDRIIHTIHLRVLLHIKTLAEAANR
jgi:uncharacterized membrane protein YhaH (DUF805 family)